jgi:hypothetical protein
VHLSATLAPVGGVSGARRLGLALCLLLAACQPRRADDLPIALRWSVVPDPAAVGRVEFTFGLTDSTSGAPVRGAQVRLEGNMSHPGMRPVLGTAQEIGPGRYRAQLDLDMAGDWFLVVDATLADGRRLRRQVDLPGVRAR